MVACNNDVWNSVRVSDIGLILYVYITSGVLKKINVRIVNICVRSRSWISSVFALITVNLVPEVTLVNQQTKPTTSPAIFYSVPTRSSPSGPNSHLPTPFLLEKQIK